jgi:hypothetical protein
MPVNRSSVKEEESRILVLANSKPGTKYAIKADSNPSIYFSRISFRREGEARLCTCIFSTEARTGGSTRFSALVSILLQNCSVILDIIHKPKAWGCAFVHNVVARVES